MTVDSTDDWAEESGDDLTPSEWLREAGEELLAHAAQLRLLSASGPSVDERLLSLLADVGRADYLCSERVSMFDVEPEPVDDAEREWRADNTLAFVFWCRDQLEDAAKRAIELAIAVYAAVERDGTPAQKNVSEMRDELMGELAMEAGAVDGWGQLELRKRDVAHEFHIVMSSIAGQVVQAAYQWREDPLSPAEAGLRAVEIAAQLTVHQARIAQATAGQYDPR